MIVAGTGHRPPQLGGYGSPNPVKARVIIALNKWLEARRRQDPELAVLSGMALGFDSWLAFACLEQGIRYEAVVPFVGQESRWRPADQSFYRYLLDNAACVHNLRPEGLGHCDAAFALQKRNVWMVDHCELLLACWNGTSGGTANCVAYAVNIERPVERLQW